PLAAGVRVAFGDLDTGAEGAGGLDVGVDVPALVVGDLLDGGLPLDHLGIPDHRDGEVTSRSPHSQTIGSGSVWFCEQPASEDAGLSLVAWVAWGVNQSIEAREATDPG